MKIRRLLIALLLVVTCALFTGCSSYVSVYRTEVNSDYYTCSVDIYASSSDLNVLEKNGKSLEAYLTALSTVCGAEANGGQFTVTKDGDGNLYSTFAIGVDSSYLSREDYSATKTQGFFFNTYTIRFKNPLDRLKNAFKNGLELKPQKGTDMYLVWVLLNGEGSLRSFTDYFGVDKSFADELALNFLVKTRMLYESDAPTEYVLTQKYFKWTTTVESADGYIEYRVKGVNSWVWYAAAIVIGLIVALVLWLVARKSKKKPELRDETEIERIRAMRRNIPSNIRVVESVSSKPSDGEVFGDNEKENGDTEEKPKDIQEND